MSAHVHRSIDRRAALSKAAEMRKSALDNVGSEVAGTLLAPATGAIGGSAIGALAGGILAGIKGKSIARGAGAGAGLGALVGGPAGHLANFGGVLAGVLRKRRTREEQQEHDGKSHWGNFIPGVASYNYTKRMGRVLSGVGEPDKEKKAAEAAFAEGFCKAAETAGVDPVALYKQAFAVGDVARLGLKAWKGLRGAGSAAVNATRNPRQTLAAAKGMGSRYLELLRGGNAQTMAPVKIIGNNAAEAAEMFGGGRLSQGFARIGSRYGTAAGAYDTMAREGLRLGSLNRADYANYLRGKGELRKVIGARAATGGLLGGGALAMRGGGEDQPQAYQGV